MSEKLGEKPCKPAPESGVPASAQVKRPHTLGYKPRVERASACGQTCPVLCAGSRMAAGSHLLSQSVGFGRFSPEITASQLSGAWRAATAVGAGHDTGAGHDPDLRGGPARAVVLDVGWPPGGRSTRCSGKTLDNGSPSGRCKRRSVRRRSLRTRQGNLHPAADSRAYGRNISRRFAMTRSCGGWKPTPSITCWGFLRPFRARVDRGVDRASDLRPVVSAIERISWRIGDPPRQRSGWRLKKLRRRMSMASAGITSCGWCHTISGIRRWRQLPGAARGSRRGARTGRRGECHGVLLQAFRLSGGKRAAAHHAAAAGQDDPLAPRQGRSPRSRSASSFLWCLVIAGAFAFAVVMYIRRRIASPAAWQSSRSRASWTESSDARTVAAIVLLAVIYRGGCASNGVGTAQLLSLYGADGERAREFIDGQPSIPDEQEALLKDALRGAAIQPGGDRPLDRAEHLHRSVDELTRRIPRHALSPAGDSGRAYGRAA